MDDRLLVWWAFLCLASAINVAGWTWSALRLRASASHLSPAARDRRRLLLWLAAGYVLGCAFRSILPMVDIPRACLHQTPVSMIFVGRSVATVAELCFAAQWALLMREASEGRDLAGMAGRLILPVILLAEIASWSAVLLSNNLLHVLENSLWTVLAMLVLAAFWALHGALPLPTRRFLQVASVCGGGYLVFMLLVDLPMYLERWLADAVEPTTLAEGLRQMLAPCVIEHRWAAWREDALWLSLYFTVAVWVSIALPHAPVLSQRR